MSEKHLRNDDRLHQPIPPQTEDSPGTAADSPRPSRAGLLLAKIKQQLRKSSPPQMGDSLDTATDSLRPSQAGLLIAEIERLNDLVTTTKVGILHPDGEGHHRDQPATPPPAFYFRRAGEVWEICYDKAKFAVPHVKGMQYLDILVHKPGKKYDALNLVSLTERKERPKKIIKAQLIEDNLHLSSHEATFEFIDPQARREFQNRYNVGRTYLLGDG